MPLANLSGTGFSELASRQQQNLWTNLWRTGSTLLVGGGSHVKLNRLKSSNVLLDLLHLQLLLGVGPESWVSRIH